MSKIYVDEITGFEGTETGAPITLSGDTATLGSGATIGSGVTGTLGTGVTFPAGHVIQTVSSTIKEGSSGNGTSITSTSWAPLMKADGTTAHELQISNVGASNSVLVTMHFNIAWYGTSSGNNIGAGVAIYYNDGSSYSALTDAADGSYHYLMQDGGGATEYRAWYGQGSLQAYHNPTNTNPTYRLYGRTRHGSGGSLRVGQPGVSITLMEIQA